MLKLNSSSFSVAKVVISYCQQNYSPNHRKHQFWHQRITANSATLALTADGTVRVNAPTMKVNVTNVVQSQQNAGDITYHTIANLSGIVQSNVALDIVGGGQSGDRYITFANIASSHDPTARTTTGVGNKSFAFGMEGEETNTTIRAVFRTNSSGSSKPCANPSSYNLEGFRLTDVGNDTNVAVDFPNINTTGASANAVFDSNNQLLKSTSSLRYKTNVQPLVNVIDTSEVLDIETKYFKHNGDNQYFWGVIAEEIEQIYPGICQYIELNGEQVVDNVDYVKLIMPLIEEVKKLRADVNDLKSGATI